MTPVIQLANNQFINSLLMNWLLIFNEMTCGQDYLDRFLESIKKYKVHLATGHFIKFLQEIV